MSRARRSGRLIVAVAATAAVNLLLILALVESTRSAPPLPPVVAAPLGVRPPPPPPAPSKPARPAPSAAAATASIPPTPPLPTLALPAVPTRALGRLPPTARPDPGDLPTLALPPTPALSSPGAGAAPTPDHAAELLFAPDLEAFYPPPARQRKTEGRTRLRLQIDARGAVRALEVLASEPVGVFEDAARAAARRLRYRPARTDGRAVPSTVTLVLRWSLR